MHEIYLVLTPELGGCSVDFLHKIDTRGVSHPGIYRSRRVLGPGGLGSTGVSGAGPRGHGQPRRDFEDKTVAPHDTWVSLLFPFLGCWLLVFWHLFD